MKRIPGDALHLVVARRLRRQMTTSEQVLWRELRKRRCGVAFRRQVPVSSFVLDFFARDCLLGIEVDGPIHKDRRNRDAPRDQVLSRLGIQVLRFTNDDVIDDLSRVVTVIRQEIEERLTAPPLRCRMRNVESPEGGTASPVGGGSRRGSIGEAGHADSWQAAGRRRHRHRERES